MIVKLSGFLGFTLRISSEFKIEFLLLKLYYSIFMNPVGSD